MQLVIADTSPINYLLLINHIELLPALFHKIILPSVVRKELSHLKAPPAVRDWIAQPPAWVEIRQTGPHVRDSALDTLDAGEEDAIALAIELRADLLLMDDEAGVIVARTKGFEVTGTLGILQRAAERQLINLAEAFDPRTKSGYRRYKRTQEMISSPGCCRPLNGLSGVIGIEFYPINMPASKFATEPS